MDFSYEAADKELKLKTKKYIIMENTMEIKDKIRKYIIDTAYVQPDSIKDDSLIFNEGIFDSMGFVLLINFIEDNFSIKAKDSELLEDNFESINAMANFVTSKLN
jgi:acyl carrier protein